jgi:hypothetical protein
LEVVTALLGATGPSSSSDDISIISPEFIGQFSFRAGFFGFCLLLRLIARVSESRRTTSEDGRMGLERVLAGMVAESKLRKFGLGETHDHVSTVYQSGNASPYLECFSMPTED